MSCTAPPHAPSIKHSLFRPDHHPRKEFSRPLKANQNNYLNQIIEGIALNQPVRLNNQDDLGRLQLIRDLAARMAVTFIRTETRFFHVTNPNAPLSRRDMEQSFINIVAQTVDRPERVTADILRSVFELAIDKKHTDRDRSIPVWNRTMACYPGNKNRIIWLPTGVVELNVWKRPPYRAVPPADKISIGVFAEFFRYIFPRERERLHVADWLAWCLQNEPTKPSWALLLYSRQKGTGKSTFCEIARTLFGEENTATQNNVEKLTSRFNATPLTSKLIVSEEFSLRPDSSQSNAIKAYITESVILSERKGKEAERLPLSSCFLFTTNHLPTWLEEGERRYYILDTDHDGHSSGPKAKEFTGLVRRVKEALEDPAVVNALYQALMTQELQDDFDAKSLNTAVHSTDLMKRIAGASRQSQVQQLDEYLKQNQSPVQTNEWVKKYVTTELRTNGNATRHMMMELGWSQYLVKWGNVDYARAIWAAPDYVVNEGFVLGPDGYKKRVAEALLGEVEL